ncbi:hypothetical protein EB001_26345, partial [bacterium]|nr:hypothetical protein [bacterium]
FDVDFAAKTTDDMTEGVSNLYFSGKDTSQLPETGTFLYFNNTRFTDRFDVDFAAKTTDDLTEGVSNLYFSGKTTEDLPESGTFLYFNNDRAIYAIEQDAILGFSGSIDSSLSHSGINNTTNFRIQETGLGSLILSGANSSITALQLNAVNGGISMDAGLSGINLLSDGRISMGNLMNIKVFADDTERDVLTPVIGDMCFMINGTAPAATNNLQYYDGGAWVNLESGSISDATIIQAIKNVGGVTGEGFDLTFGTTGLVTLYSESSEFNSIYVNSVNGGVNISANNGGIDLTCGTTPFQVNAGGSIQLNAHDESYFSTTSGNLTIENTAGDVLLHAASGIVGITGGLVASSEQITSSGAISLNHLITTFDTTLGEITATLANGEIGQMKILVGEIIAAGVTATITPTTPLGFASVAFNLTGASANLL